MKTQVKQVRSSDKIITIYATLVVLWGVIGMILLMIRATENEYNVGGAFLTTFFYFTTQSNILITIIALLVLMKKYNRKWFDRLAFIGLVNIFVTGVIFHTLLIPYLDDVSFMNHVLHTINPLLYFGLYFIFLTTSLKAREFLFSMIYPIIYLAIVFTIIEPIFGNLLEEVAPDFSGARYVYPFLDPRNFPRGVPGMIAFNFGLLAPVISLVAWLLLTLKLRLERTIQA